MDKPVSLPRGHYVPITVTYLELTSREQLRPVAFDDRDLLLLEAHEPTVEFYRYLYDAVGREFTWTDRLQWSDERLAAHLARPEVTLVVLYLRGVPAGYFELDQVADEPGETGTELAYFGIFPAYHGRGLGKYLLAQAVTRAFDDGATRVWLHTCSLDGPHAIPNYQARGFVAYKTEEQQQLVFDTAGLSPTAGTGNV